MLTIADDLHARSIGVRILTGKLSGSYSPRGEGKFFFTMMAAFAELERDIIHERTMAGLAAARAQGKAGGRPTVMDPDKLAAARARRARGESPTLIAKALGISRASVYRHLGSDSRQDQASFGGALDVPYLFVSDGSVMTTGAAANPTLTIVALARCPADRMEQQMKAGSL